MPAVIAEPFQELHVVPCPGCHHVPARLFWRRGFAYLIDVITANLLIWIVLLVLSLAASWFLGVSMSEPTTCEQAATGPAVALIEREWPLDAGEERLNIVCRSTSVLGAGSWQFTSYTRSGSSSDAFRLTRSVSFPVDARGAPLAESELFLETAISVPLASLPWLLTIGLFIVFGAQGRRTPGKRLMGLRVTTEDGIPPGLERSLRRELWKFMPLLAGTVLILPVLIVAVEDLRLLIAFARDGAVPNWVLAVVLPAVLAGAVWWLGPFLRWRGQTFHDRLAGTVVRRA
ncbi:RDD family protein [Ensifer soli]|uniref:RDD family protein n=1 Tax=Ciceribacter sp. sgz301302 TaxID=3342379 RepID=UPI0035B6B50C